MKKLVTLLVVAGFLITTAPMAHAGGFHRFHHHGRGAYGNYGAFWLGLSAVVLTGALITSLSYQPPPRTVVYYDPPPLVVHTAPYATSPTPRHMPHVPGRVTVNVELLNVRSGPGLDRAVGTRVHRGETLEVIGTAPGWLYVRTPAGHYGWVMAQYTSGAWPKG